MGFFSKLGRVFRDISDPGGTLIYKATGGKGSRPNNIKSGLNPIASPQAPQAGTPFTPKPAFMDAPGGINSYPALKLGWTNGGYNYANNPAPGFQQQAPPMSFGGGGGGQGMGMSGPEQLQVGSPAASMPTAGAPAMSPPTGHQYIIDRLRQRPV